VSLDEGDNDPIVFWSSLVASTARVIPNFGSTVVPVLSSMSGLALDVVARILNELDALDQQIVLVLDDYHRIISQESHETVALLLERQPPTMQLIISTRPDPPLPPPRLRADGRLIELRAADLGFSDTEAAEALRATGE
jgi:LuxR family maltose regulon positive regulatory protein